MSKNSTTTYSNFNKIKLLYKFFTKRRSWYTGLAIKRYIKKEIFSITSDFNNPAITAGRWSAYCHYSLILSFTNLLHKNQITSDSVVFVHPLLPAPLIDQLLSFNCKVVSLDINKNTLTFEPNSLLAYLRQLRSVGKAPDLIIYYNFNGLYKDVISSVKESQKIAIPSLMVIDNPNVNHDLIDIFKAQTLGGIVWNFGDSFFDDHLDQVLDVDLRTQNWYISWSIETRMRSLLEYHLSKSHEVYELVFEAYFYKLLAEYQKLDWKARIYRLLANKYLLKNTFKDEKMAVDIIKSRYPELFHAAVPDVVFDLQLNFPEKYPKSDIEMTYNSGELQQKAKALYDLFNQYLPNRPPGSLEIPEFYLDQTYLKYFVYTTEPKYWQEILEYKGYQITKLSEIHQTFWQKSQLTKANFITKFLISIDLC